ncbi:MAG: hypothetical protein HOV83_38205 [Catenulispora sp.]|nr:hypothetical protein [Catenulispora sp.]
MSAPHEDDRAPARPGGDGGDGGHEGFGGLDGPLTDAAAEALGAVLRERMQQVVAGLEPHPAALDLLHRAVPARRRRRQAALATATVTVLAVGAGAALAARGSLSSPEPVRAGGTYVGNLMSTGTNGAPGAGSGHGPGPVGGGQFLSSSQPAADTASASAASLSQTSMAQPTASTSAASATGVPVVPMCQESSVLSVVGTQSAPSGGVSYETVTGTVKTACSLAGTPTLTVSDAHGAPGHVPQYRPDPAVTPLLAKVPAGQTLVLQPGDRFQFQFAWVPQACSTQPTPTSSPTSAPTSSLVSETILPTTPATSLPTSVSATGATAATPTQPTPTGGVSSSAANQTSYSVAFAVSGKQAQQTASFAAACGAALYVTDYFQPAKG